MFTWKLLNCKNRKCLNSIGNEIIKKILIHISWTLLRTNRDVSIDINDISYKQRKIIQIIHIYYIFKQ